MGFDIDDWRLSSTGNHLQLHVGILLLKLHVQNMHDSNPNHAMVRITLNLLLG